MPNSSLDLHIHSALSPCAAEEMRPPAVLLMAERQGLDVVGIVDHSTGRNGWAFLEAAPAFAVRVLVGLEIETSEGVHLLALFGDRAALEDFDALIAQHLPGGRNRPEVLGPQLLLDEWGEVIGEDDRLLISAVDLGLERLADMIAAHEGVSIAAHVDRAANGLLPTLGFVPPKLRVDLMEVSWRTTRSLARQRWPELGDWPLVCSSDAHVLEEIGKGRTVVGGEGKGNGSSPLALSLARGTAAGEGEGEGRGNGKGGGNGLPAGSWRSYGLRAWVAEVAEALRGDGDA
jgi:predicted metal-dependent phosphoesterase TrpH